jgi:uncharacterized protein with HEPN domain
MSKHAVLLLLPDMLDHAREAIALSHGRSRDDLNSDRLLSLALVRLLEIIGEAATRVPPEIQSKPSGIPWPEIIGLRNRLVHGYGAIDLDIVWRIITADLPPLVIALEKLIEAEKQP